MKALNLYRLDQGDHLVKPCEFSDLSEQSPALELMTDFRTHQPHTVKASASALGVAKLMVMEGIPYKLVVDQQREFVGLLTAEQLSEQSILMTQILQNIERSELTAADIMMPRAAIPALDYEALKTATVKDLMSTMGGAGESHCLVLDRNQHHIRGVITIEEIAGRLHQTVSVKSKPSIAKALQP